MASPPQSLDNANTSASQLFLGNTALKSFTEQSYVKRVAIGTALIISTRKETPPMSPSSQNPDAQELAGQIDAIRADIQSLTSTVSRIANKQSEPRPGQGAGCGQPGGRGDQAEPAHGGRRRRRPRLPVRRLHPALEARPQCSARRSRCCPRSRSALGSRTRSSARSGRPLSSPSRWCCSSPRRSSA